MNPRRETLNAGANKERTAILARFRRRHARFLKRPTQLIPVSEYHLDILWLEKRAARYNAKPGGLGKPRKPQ